MPRRSTRRKPAGPLRETSTRQRRLTAKKQALLDQQSYNPQVDAHQQSEDEQSQDEHHSSPTSPSSPPSPPSLPIRQPPPSNMFKHNRHPQEDAITDHTSDSSGTEEVDITQYQDQEASHTAFEHAPSLLLLASSRTPPRSSDLPSLSPAPSQLPLPKAPRRHQKAPRPKAAPGQAKSKPVTQKRTLTKRKAKESVRSTKRQKKKVRFVNNPDGGNDGDDHENDTDDVLEPYLDPETPMQIQMPLHHMMPPYLPSFHPDTTAYHQTMTYHGVASARDMLFLQYQVAAQEAFERNEQWGYLWNQSSLMEQRAASVLVEFKFLTPLVPLASLVPLVVPSPAGVLYPPQLHPHGYFDGNPECYYEA